MSLWTRSITGRLLTVVHRNCFITVIEDTRSNDAMRKIRIISDFRYRQVNQLAPTDLQSAVARLRGQFLRDFDEVENVVVPWFLVSTHEGERLSLPMIDV